MFMEHWIQKYEVVFIIVIDCLIISKSMLDTVVRITTIQTNETRDCHHKGKLISDIRNEIVFHRIYQLSDTFLGSAEKCLSSV